MPRDGDVMEPAVSSRPPRRVLLLAAAPADVDESLRSTISTLSPSTSFVDAVDESTHVLVVLTSRLLDEKWAALEHVAALPRARSIFVMDPAWDWGALHERPPGPVKACIQNHEALEYRARGSYEHAALVKELLRRMRVL